MSYIFIKNFKFCQIYVKDWWPKDQSLWDTPVDPRQPGTDGPAKPALASIRPRKAFNRSKIVLYC